MASLFEELGTACLAPTSDAPLGYLKCDRCRGTGMYSHHVRRRHFGIPGLCLQCDGAGRARIDTPEEIEARRIAKVRADYRMKAVAQIKDAVTSRHDIRVAVFNGIGRLERFAPERFAKMLHSVYAGRLEEVVSALAEYEKTEQAADWKRWRETQSQGASHVR